MRWQPDSGSFVIRRVTVCVQYATFLEFRFHVLIKHSISARDIVFFRDLMRHSERLTEELKNFKVVAVKRFKKKFNGGEQSIPALLLALETLVLLESVKLVWYHL